MNEENHGCIRRQRTSPTVCSHLIIPRSWVRSPPALPYKIPDNGVSDFYSLGDQRASLPKVVPRLDQSQVVIRMLNRTPPSAIRRQLRREVGFGCPARDCGIPYLTWHHFDPPWRDRQHHEPEGMIALCLLHAGQADAGAFTKERLQELKRKAPENAEEIRGELTWMRREVLALVGGNWYFDTPTILQVGNTSAIAFDRDADGYLLLNLRFPSPTGMPRVRIVENFFTVNPDQVDDVACAARGRTIQIDYANGDRFSHQYRDIRDQNALLERYGLYIGGPIPDQIRFPLTVVEVSERTQGILDFDAHQTWIGGMRMTRSWSISNHVGVMIGATREQERVWFP